MQNTLAAQEMPLHKLFGDDFSFSIPAVQRPYAWTTEQVGELLDDLLEFIDHHGINKQNIDLVKEPYFLGSIVLVKAEKPEAEVLDGQQRLTTLTILFSALRYYLTDEFASDIECLIVQKGNRTKLTKDQYRIALRKKDNEFFQRYIQEQGKFAELNDAIVTRTDSQQLIRDNALYLLDRFNDLDKETLEILSIVLVSLCYIVVVSTPNFDSAFRIFTVLNDRGLDLMVTDILKAKIIGQIDDADQDLYTERWEDIEVSLGRDKFNELFSLIRMIVQKRKGANNLKDEYDLILNDYPGKAFINDLLIPYSEIYLQLRNFNETFKKEPRIVQLVAQLNRIDNIDWMPLVMYYMHKYNRNLEVFLAKVERFAAVHMILKRNFNWRQSQYSIVLKELTQANGDFSDLLTLTSEDRDRLIELIEGDVYKNVKDTAKRYILLKLDQLLAQGQPNYAHTTVTIEHVLPQTPDENSEWSKLFPNPEEYVHKLGNLVLLTRNKNARARNYDFAKKKESYFQTKSGINTFALTTEVIKKEKWTPEVIEQRQKKLVTLLLNDWQLMVK